MIYRNAYNVSTLPRAQKHHPHANKPPTAISHAHSQSPTTLRHPHRSYVAVRNNQLQTELFLPQSEVYTLWTGFADDPAIGSRVSDFELQVDVSQTRGGDDAAYGIRFRQNTTDSYIMAAINARGYWRIIRASFGDISDITPWQFSRHIVPGLN
ncbi:MAG: hypothetical protein EBS29_14855, partial [Chloroflexia bacterium]|nr:hypothetical protein [Chloroflexia bacterium]